MATSFGPGMANGAVSRNVQRICTQSGVSLIKARLVTLKDLERGMKQAVHEAEVAEKSEEFWGKALIAAKFTKAICDVMVDVLSEWSPSPIGKITKAIYEQKDIMADASVGKVDAYKIAHNMVSLASGRLADTGKISENSNTVVKEIGKRTDLVKDALMGKLDGKKIGKYIADGHLDIAEKALKEINGDKAGKIASSVKSIVNFSYELYQIVEERKIEMHNGIGIAGAKKSAISVLRNLQVKIKSVENQLDSCEVAELQIRLQ